MSIVNPEEYKIIDEENNNMLAYIRLRWGILTCHYPNKSGERIYAYNFFDVCKGEFENELERQKYLTQIADKVKKALVNQRY